MSGYLSPLPVLKFFDNNGNSLAFGFVYTYAAGTTTPLATYTDSTLGTANPNPIELNFRGECSIWIPANTAYKINLTDNAGNQIPGWPVDQIQDPLFVASASTIGQIIFPQTAAEVSAGVTPTNYQYQASPFIDPRRYNAGLGLGTTVDTAGITAAVNVALAGNGRIWLCENFSATCNPMSFTLSGTELTKGLIIEGASFHSRINVSNAQSTPLFTFANATPAVPIVYPITFRNMSFYNPNAITVGGHGVQLTGLAYAQFSGCQVYGFDRGISLLSSLEILIDQQCQIDSNNNGVYTIKTAAEYDCNQITIANCRLSGNLQWAINFNSGSLLKVRECDIEQNGTSGFTTTGGIYTGTDLAVLNGLAKVELESNWVENNYGSAIYIDSPASGTQFVSIRGGLTVATQVIGTVANAITVASGVNTLLIEDHYSPSGTIGTNADTWNLNATYGYLKNTLVTQLLDNITWKSYHNARTSVYTDGGDSRNGSFQATLTGCTTSPTCTVTYSINGSMVMLNIGANTATSNTTACTLTGLPAALTPTTSQNVTAATFNNSVEGTGQININGTTLTLYSAPGNATFTNTGTKGLPAQTISYQLTT